MKQAIGHFFDRNVIVMQINAHQDQQAVLNCPDSEIINHDTGFTDSLDQRFHDYLPGLFRGMSLRGL
jgi:hypothetical protein